MKNVNFLTVIIFFAFLSCRSDEGSVQRIDQVINLYIDSLGQDMLNSNIPGSYLNIQGNDVYGLADSSPVNFSNKKDADTINYIEYLAGAKRILIDSSDVNAKIYQSKITFILTKKLTDSTTSTFNDNLILNYVMKPEYFRIENAWYNNKLVFTKVDGQPNIIKISK